MFVAPAYLKGSWWVGMARVQRAGRGLRSRCIVGRFSEVVIACHRDCYLSLQDDLLAKMIKIGVPAVDLTMALSILPATESIPLAKFVTPASSEGFSSLFRTAPAQIALKGLVLLAQLAL